MGTTTDQYPELRDFTTLVRLLSTTHDEDEVVQLAVPSDEDCHVLVNMSTRLMGREIPAASSVLVASRLAITLLVREIAGEDT